MDIRKAKTAESKRFNRTDTSVSPRGAIREKRQKERMIPAQVMGRIIHWASRVLIVCSVATVVAGSIYMVKGFVEKTSSRPVNSVSIEGDFIFLTKEQLAKMVAPMIDDGFLRLPLEGLKAKLEANPWIESAALSRRWPDKLNITIIEQQPIARWGSKGFLNYKGEVVVVEQTPFLESLPVLEGNPGQEQAMMRDYQQLAQFLRPYGLKIEELSCDPLMSWQIVLGNGISLTIGRDQMMEKIQRFLVVYSETLKNQDEQISSVDLRYGNGVAVKWKEATVQHSEETKKKQNNKA